MTLFCLSALTHPPLNSKVQARNLLAQPDLFFFLYKNSRSLPSFDLGFSFVSLYSLIFPVSSLIPSVLLGFVAFSQPSAYLLALIYTRKEETTYTPFNLALPKRAIHTRLQSERIAEIATRFIHLRLFRKDRNAQSADVHSQPCRPLCRPLFAMRSSEKRQYPLQQ